MQAGAPSIIYCVGSSDWKSFYHGVHSLPAPRVGVCNNVYTTLVPNATPDLTLPLSKYEYKNNKMIGEPSTPASYFSARERLIGTRTLHSLLHFLDTSGWLLDRMRRDALWSSNLSTIHNLLCYDESTLISFCCNLKYGIFGVMQSGSCDT